MWRRELAAARWTRRLGVPAWMIAAATARRAAGDWRGACAAANVDVELDPSVVVGTVEDDLRHLVPDLLRWHLDPAVPVTVLSHHGAQALYVRRRSFERLALRYGPVPPDALRGSLVYSRELWDSRHTAALGARSGGAASRVPFLDADGSRLPPERWGFAEQVITLQDAGDWAGAWRLAGFDPGPRLPRPSVGDPARWTWRLSLTGLRAAVGPLPADIGSVLARVPAALVERPVDADLVRLGMLPVSALHPLVGAALFPGLSTMPPVPAPGTGPVRVRRDGAWRFAEPGDLGWHDPLAALPKALRLRRDTVVRLARHGDAPALSAWLAAGGDPYFRDPARRTMLHLLAAMPAGRAEAAEAVETLLLELLAAGLDLEARDGAGMTPLLYGIAHDGPVSTIRALVTMGADVRAVTFGGAGWADLARTAGLRSLLRSLLRSFMRE